MQNNFKPCTRWLALALMLYFPSTLLKAGDQFPGPRAPRLLQKSAPDRPIPSVNRGSQNPQEGSSTPGSKDPLTIISRSWEGIPTDFTLEPPDPSGAAGPNGILATVNLRLAYYDKTGRAIWGPVDHSTFFASVGINATNLLADPHTLFDRDSSRFFTILQEADLGNSKSYLNIAVSKTANPTTSAAADWLFYRIENTETNGTNSFWSDYPGLGIDNQAVYVTYNMFSFPLQTARFTNAEVIVLDKAALISGTTNYALLYVNGFTLQPCTVLGSGSPGNVAYFAETLFTDSTRVRIWSLSDPLGARTFNSALVAIPDNGGVAPFSGAPQPGTSIGIDTLDTRAQGNAFWLDGNIWFCNTAGGSSGKSKAYYYQVGLNGFPSGTPSLIEEGSIDGGPGEWTFQPSIGANALGDVGIVFCQSSATRNPTIFATTRKAGAVFFDPPALIRASPGFYFGFRWGDFASVTADPVDESFWVTHEWARSSQIVDWGTWWANVIPTTAPNFVFYTNYVTKGNDNGVIDFNECNDVFLVFTNVGSLGATNIQATLSSSTPGVLIVQPRANYPDIPIGGSGTNLSAFRVSTSPFFNCGAPITFNMLLKTDQGSFTNTFRVPTGGAGKIFRFDNSVAVPIPDNNPAGANSSVVVSNITSAIAKVTVSLYLTHTFDSDLTISLISPGGITNVLSAHNGSFGDNYGLSCSPDSRRTTFDDDSRFSIIGASAPFIGIFSPEQPLSVFAGASGTNANGTWTLRIVDDAAFDVGTLQCWSLSLNVPTCSDGGGECPGSDLAIGMTASPEPTLVGNNLTYSISVTNRGPTIAKNVVVSHLLPSSVIFLSANTSQGSYSQSGGAVSISFGTVPAGSRCFATVVVQPTVQGTLSSSATVTSSQFDPDLSNNTISILSHAAPPSAELTVGLDASPEPVLVGGSLTYSVTVTNNGPSFATGVTVTNILPPSMTILSANVSQGSLNVFSNIVVLNVGSLSSSARANASILATPNVEGSLTATSIVSAVQIDPITTNNIATFTSTIGQAADLELTLLDSPDPVVVRSNVTYIMTVTNHGPNIATSVLLRQTLPAGITVVSNSTTQGTISRNGNALTANIGTLGLGAGASIVVVVNPPNATTLSTVATVSSSQADPNTANNTITATTVVAPPFVSIVPSGAAITFESITPTNGAVDIGETVGVSLRLRNAGNVVNTNLTATLLTNNGVIPDPGAANVQNYGVLPAGGAPVGLPFRFKAVGTNGGSVSAVLQLQDGANNLGTATFNFGLPNVFNFSNTNAITIRDNSNALPYPSTISVSGITGIVGKVTATLIGANHTFPQDVDALLVGASAQKTILMSGAGAAPLANATVTFDDAAAPLPDGSAQINTGSYHPASYSSGSNLPPPGPAGPYLAAMSVFNNANPNGTWSLYVADHSAGDSGAVTGGWNLAVTTISPVNQLADLSLVATAAPNPALVGSPLTNVFTIVNTGPNDTAFVTFTDPLPAGVTLLSATSSRGSVITGSGNVSVNVGPLSAGQSATIAIAFIPSPANLGSLANLAGVSSTDTDLNPANNSATASATVNLPVADLVLAQVAPTNSIVVGSNLACTFALTNNGPGNALNAVISNTLPAGLGFISATSSVGVASFAGGTVVADLGTLAPGTWAVVTLNASAASVGTFTNIAVASSLSTDPSPANNSAAAQLTIVNPSPSITSAGARLISESLTPGNGTVDNGETVTVSLALRNVGSADTANLTATLQNSGGVTPVGTAQKSYGQLVHGGAPANNTFTFTASGTNGGVVVASLMLQDGATSLGTVTFSFDLPATTTFANSAAIVIPDHGSAVPYPASINVSGLTGAVSNARVTLNGFTHSFPRDVNVLLVSPNGANVVLMSHVGGAHSVTNLILTFDDTAPASLSDSALLSGTMKPAAFGTVTFPIPAPAKGYGAALAAVTGGSPNGSWSLFVLDDSVGDAGNIASGWSLELTTLNPVNPVADLSVTIASAPTTVLVGGVYTNAITVNNAGPNLATGVSVTSTIPSGVTLVSASSSQGTIGGLVNGQVIATLGDIASGANANLSLVLAPSVVGTLTNDVRVAAGETDLNVGNNAAQSVIVVTTVQPAILSGSITNAQFALTIEAQPNSTYVIQASTNLTSWVALSTNTASAAGFIKFTDPSPLGSQRYYRTVRVQP